MLKEFNPPKDVEKEALKEEIKALRERLLAQQQLVRSSNLPVIVLVEGKLTRVFTMWFPR